MGWQVRRRTPAVRSGWLTERGRSPARPGPPPRSRSANGARPSGSKVRVSSPSTGSGRAAARSSSAQAGSSRPARPRAQGPERPARREAAAPWESAGGRASRFSVVALAPKGPRFTLILVVGRPPRGALRADPRVRRIRCRSRPEGGPAKNSRGGQGEKSPCCSNRGACRRTCHGAGCFGDRRHQHPKASQGVSVDGILEHERALQRIALANGGNRAATTAGYDDSVAYVVTQAPRRRATA